MNLYLISAIFVFFFRFSPDQPEFKGGAKSLDSFISRNLIYPEYSKFNCLQGTVQVSFHVTHSGRIFDSSIQKGYKTDLDKEALRIVRLTAGKWIVPAGFDTTNAIVLPIKFILSEFKCEEKQRDEIAAAITAYRSREGLTRAIFNFYDKKNAGQYDAADERHILELKDQLGYDDKFISRMIKQGNTKLKQGDNESACEDYTFVKRIGSGAADKMIAATCGKQL